MNFTILMPVYNTNPLFIFEAIQSCFTQTLQPAEVLLIDDGSTDPKTVKFLSDVQSGFDPRLKILFANHGGISNALNLGLMKAENDWIARMDADDVMMPHRLERQASAIQTIKTDVLSSQLMFFGKELGPFTNHPVTVSRELALNHENGWFTNHAPSIYHRNIILQLGGYDPVHDGCEDIELWYRLLANNRTITTLSDVLYLCRLHPGQVTQKPRSINLPLFKSYLQNRRRMTA